MPNAHSPEGIEVEVYRKEVRKPGLESDLALVFSTNADASGRWKVDSLAAGPWLVKLRIPGTIASDVGFDSPFLERCIDVPWIFDVPKGATARADIDLRTETLCTLDGTLTVGDNIKEGYAQLLLEPPLALTTAFGGVEAGRFELVARRPGRYRLLINAGPGHDQYKVITDLIDLVPGKNQWHRDLPVDQWDGNGIRIDQH